jgi:hypothetical protein
MSKKMQMWCRKRGDLVRIEGTAIQETVSPQLLAQGLGIYGEALWGHRSQWFKKPFACVQSPYRVGLWLDVDCEVLGPLEPLIASFQLDKQLALAREVGSLHLPKLHPRICYNGGVILFAHGAPLVEQWVASVPELNAEFMGDDLLLSHLIYKTSCDVQEIPALYNWRLHQGINFEAQIFHWMGPKGKDYVRTYGGLAPLVEGLSCYVGSTF